MRIIFMGTPDFSVPTLTRIAEAGHTIVAVYTQPPRPAGRGQELRKSPVHLAAEKLGIPVFTPKNFKQADDVERFSAHRADVGIVVAYGLLLPKAILAAPVHGCLNLHGSLLPRWRGAAPIQRAIMAGDQQTGVMVMQMDIGLDTGPVALTENIAIPVNMTAGELHDEMMGVGSGLMVQALAALDRGDLTFDPQPEQGATYAKKIDKAEARIDWSETAEQVHNRIRGLSPFPGAWFEIELQGKAVRIKALKSQVTAGKGPAGTVLNDSLTIATGAGAIKLLTVQRQGKGVMDAADFLRGAGDLPGRTIT